MNGGGRGDTWSFGCADDGGRGRRGRRGAIVATATAFLLTVFATIALADSITRDGDTATVGTGISVSGSACGTSSTFFGDLHVAWSTSNPADLGGTQVLHFAPGETLALDVSVPAGSGIVSGDASGGAPVVPTAWVTNGQSFDIVIYTIVPAGIASGTYPVTYTATGTTSGYHVSTSFNVSVDCPSVAPAAGTIDGPDTVDEGTSHTYTSDASSSTGPLSYSWSVTGDAQIAGGQGTDSVTLESGDGPGSATLHLEVSDGSGGTASPTDEVIAVRNVPPTTPGVPAVTAGANPGNTGELTLGWTASTDVPQDTVAYTLIHLDTDDVGYSVVASGLTTNGYTFTAGSAEGEGTWTYRVIATDEDGGFSPASVASDPVTVDLTAPNAPSLAADRAPDFAGGGGWYLDTVTVTASGNGDPALIDGSPGSGVDGSTLPGPQTFDTSGSPTVTATVDDLAGNRSARTSLTVQVDAAAPSVQITCPTGALAFGSSAAAAWSASDGESGLATPAAGTVTLDTGSIGTHTAWAPTAIDNVGHESDPAGCTYAVGFEFGGFLEPISDDGVNVVQAGRVVPVRWRLIGADGEGVSDPASFVAVTTVGGPCDGSDASTSVERFAGRSNLRYLGDGVWRFDWKVPKSYAGQCRTMYLNLSDETHTGASSVVLGSSTRAASFRFR